MTTNRNKLPTADPSGSARATAAVGADGQVPGEYRGQTRVSAAAGVNEEGAMPRNNALTRRLAELERQRAVLLEVAQLVIDTATIETPDKLLKAATLAIRIAEVLP